MRCGDGRGGTSWRGQAAWSYFTQGVREKVKVPKAVDELVNANDRFVVAGAVNTADGVNGAAVVSKPPDNVGIVK